MAVNRKAANQKKLDEADEIQHKTHDALHRIEREVEETAVLGAHTLEQLRTQGQQMDEINSEIGATDAKLDTTQALHKRFHVWTGGWATGTATTKKAQEEIKHQHQQQHATVREVFQQEKYSALHRQWHAEGLVLCTDTSVVCEDLFDPVTALKVDNGHWTVDYSLAGIDPEGWTYGTSFATLDEAGVGSATAHWNSYVRRRKWLYTDAADGDSGMQAFAARNSERKDKAASEKHEHVEKVGYVPREHVAANLHATGRTSASMSRSNSVDQELDEGSAAGLQRLRRQDLEMDATLDAIAGGIDELQQIGAVMKDEVTSHHQKVDKMEGGMQKIATKQEDVNAAMRHQLHRNK